ncbi:MAG: 5'-3' exonuclease [Aquificaceae bacterium]|nr:5'-3' exonuclease [Aquificaceae bacterium]MDW8237741.1 5'-3' exonuclease H3TH domain-containing protein [Aquificaceae bacterium]
MKTIYLLDSHALIYRSFFALPKLATKDGFPTSALFGFLKTTFKIFKDKPRFAGAIFDHPSPTHRDLIYSAYKATRPSMPDELKLQLPVIKKACELIGISLLEIEGYEADDIIYTITKIAQESGFEVLIISPDKDLLQLVDERVKVFNPLKEELFDRQKVFEKFGVYPEQIRDFLALVGDKVDNVPGVKGIGPKTAPEVLKRYKSVEAILNSWEDFSKEFPKANKEELKLSYELIGLKLIEKPIASIEELSIKPMKMAELKDFLEKYEIKSLLKELSSRPTPTQQSLF